MKKKPKKPTIKSEAERAGISKKEAIDRLFAWHVALLENPIEIAKFLLSAYDIKVKDLI